MTKSSASSSSKSCAPRERSHLGAGEPEPVHAGVEVQQRTPSAAPTLDLREAVQHGPRVELDERVDGARQRAFEYPDLGVGSQRAQLPRFRRRRNEKSAATFAQQAAHDALDAETVSIGFDDRGAVRRHGAVAQQPEVTRQRVEIDAQRGRPWRIGRPLSRHTAADPL